MLLTINVTEEDGQVGQQFDPGQCPVAIAIARQFPQGTWVCVGSDCWHYRFGVGDVHDLPLPKIAMMYIKQYDNGDEKPEPITFQVEIPDEVFV